MTLNELKKFCAVNGIVAWLESPFTIGEHTYASDGCVIVRIPKVEGFTEPTEVRAKRILRWFEPGFGDWVKVPVCKRSRQVPCIYCEDEPVDVSRLGYQLRLS